MDSSEIPADILARDAVLQAADQFGDYHIESCISEGLLGRIYSVLHMDTNEAFSLCVLPYRASKDTRLGGRLRRYAQQASELHHPNLVLIREWKIIRGRFCLLMEPIKGRALAKLRQDKINDLDEGFDTIGWKTTENYTLDDISILSTYGFGEQWSKDVVTSLAEVLNFLQEKRLVHGALAPNYIFVDAVGHVQTALGGLMSVLGRALFEVIVSSEIQPVNGAGEERTPNVIDALSPEVQSGTPPSMKSDLYALGILSYWIYTGRLYPALPTHVALEILRPDLGRDWSDIIETLLDPDPEHRLNSPASLLYRLNECKVEAAPIEIENTSVVEVAAKAKKSAPQDGAGKKPSIVIICLLLVLLLGGGGYALYMMLGVFSEPEPEPIVQAQPKPRWAEVQVYSTPGARVMAVNMRGTEIALGTVPENGILLAEEVVQSGKHRFIVSHPDFETFETDIIAMSRSETNVVDVALVALPGYAEIWTNPNGADIYMNGVLKGQSPVRLTDIPAGQSVLFEARLPERRSKSQSITIEPNSGVVIDFGAFDFQQAFVVPKVTLQGEVDPSIVALTEFFLNGEPVEFVEGQLEVLPGEHILSAEHPDYQRGEQTFQLQDTQTMEVPIALSPKPGILRVDSTLPAGAQISVNGQRIDYPKSGEIVFALPPRTEHSIQFKARDYFTVARKVAIQPNRTEVIRPVFKKLPGPETEQIWMIPYLNLRMVPIAAGTFSMGSPLPEHARLPNEGPIIKRNLDQPFWVGSTEVTQRIFQAVMGNNPSEFSGLDYPVDSVSWDQAMLFCERLNQIETAAGRLPSGYQYRLPTEAEWEYVARAGTDSPYVWGGYAHSALGNFSGVYPRGATFDAEHRDHYGTVQVGSYEPNAWGLYDVHGNVREWMLNVYNSRLPQMLDLGANESSSFLRRTQRGGGWEDLAPACRSATRIGASPELQGHATGFRIVLAPEVDLSEI